MSSSQTAMKSVHAFSLVSMRSDSHYKSVVADFTPPPTYTVCQVRLNKASNSIVPVYLQDGNSFTQAFVTAREKEYYASTSAVERVKFDARISKANQLCSEGETDTLTPAQLSLPVPTNNYCQICKATFLHYDDHLKEWSHQRDARFSKCNTYISQLCRLYRRKNKNAGPNPKPKQIRKSTSIKCSSNPSGKDKGWKEGRLAKGASKHLNYSTNVPSLLPTPDC